MLPSENNFVSLDCIVCDDAWKSEIIMFDLKVVGLDEAIVLVQQNWPTRIVSLTDDDALQHGPKHLHIQVDDANFVTPHWRYPTREHLLQVLDYTKDLTAEDRLLVHCLAGISRSTAVAIAVLIDHGMSYQDAFERVNALRHILIPNKLFIQYTDEHFNLDGKLIEHAAQHRQTMIGEAIYGQPETDINVLLSAFKL